VSQRQRAWWGNAWRLGNIRLVSYRVIVELISATTTKTGLTVRCELDTGQYPSGIVVSDAEMAAIGLLTVTWYPAAQCE